MNRRAQANRTPWFVFGTLIVLAVIAKIFSPPTPVVPGPKGSMQTWYSNRAIGTMDASSVNPSGTMWAGAWNAKDKNGKDISSVWTIDFEKQSTDHTEHNSKTKAIQWTSDTKAEPANAATPSSRDMASQLVAKSNEDYLYVDPATKTEKPAFTQKQLPGIIEGSWASSSGILMLCRNFDSFSEVVFDTKTNKLNFVGKDCFKTEVKTNWPDAPKEMFFVTYRGGFKVDLATCKATKLFDYADLKAIDDHWRSNIQDGRLYPRKDGGYTSVSYEMGYVDIRSLDKDGKLEKNLLPRN